MSSCSDVTLFWCLFLSFICRNHPFLLQRFWQTIRGYTRWEWLRRCLKAQPIWTLFPTVPFLNHHLMSTANVPYLPYTCPHFCLPPSTTSLTTATSLSSFFFTVPDYISRDDGVIVFPTAVKLKLRQAGGDFFGKGDSCRGGWSSARTSGRLVLTHSKMMQNPPVEVNPQIRGCLCLILGRFKEK